MKLDETTPDAIEIVTPVQEKKEISLGSLSLHKGHTLFEINTKTGTINEAKFETVKVSINYLKEPDKKGYLELFKHKKGFEVRKKLIVLEDCIYIGALNKKNAIKIFINKKIKSAISF